MKITESSARPRKAPDTLTLSPQTEPQPRTKNTKYGLSKLEVDWKNNENIGKPTQKKTTKHVSYGCVVHVHWLWAASCCNSPDPGITI
eukprot:6484596-Amphidinium_carterae.1